MLLLVSEGCSWRGRGRARGGRGRPEGEEDGCREPSRT